MVDHIHIFGASGSGTTTLAKALAKELGCIALDTDDYFWEPTTPKFQQPRSMPQRLELLSQALQTQPRWVLSGSLCGWGDPLVSSFDLVVFLHIPKDIRMARLLERERLRYGEPALNPEGAMYQTHVAFMAWAASYDEGGLSHRSLARHRAWMRSLACPVVQIEGLYEVPQKLELLKKFL